MTRYLGVMTDEFLEMMTPMVINVTPVNGQTVSVPATNKKEIFLNLAPATNLASLSITLPTTFVGQRCFIGSTRQITSCAVSSAITVNNGSLAFNPGDNAAFVGSNITTWSRVLTS